MKSVRYAFPAISLLLALLLSLLIWHYGFVQYGGEDGGIALNAAWQLHLGYEPYRDVVATGLPPLFLLGGKWAFAIGGPTWGSLVGLAAFYSFVTLLIQVWLFRKIGWPMLWCLGVALCSQTTSLLQISWWWFNPMTSVGASIFLAAAIFFYRNPERREARLVLVAATVLLSWCKPNVAGVALAMTYLLFFLMRSHRAMALKLLGISTSISVALLLVAGVQPLEMIKSYLMGGSRVRSENSWYLYLCFVAQWEVVQTFYLSIPMLLAGLGSFLASRTRTCNTDQASSFWSWLPQGDDRAVVAFACVGVLTSILAMCTNNDLNMVELSPCLVTTAWFVLHFLPKIEQSRSKVEILALLFFSIAALTANGLRVMHNRSRIMEVGYGTFYEDQPLRMIERPAVLQGVYAGPRLLSVNTAIEKFLEDRHALRPDASVFFGPRLLHAYAAFGIRPCKQLPLWWQLFDMNKPYTAGMIEHFKAARFEIAIFLARDYIYMPQPIVDSLYSEYEVYDFGDVTIHVRKDLQQPTAK